MPTFGCQLINCGRWSNPIGNSLQYSFWQRECSLALRFTACYSEPVGADNVSEPPVAVSARKVMRESRVFGGEEYDCGINSRRWRVEQGRVPNGVGDGFIVTFWCHSR